MLALVDGVIAGMALFYPLWDSCRCQTYFYLDDCSVTSKFRRLGLGGKLVQAVWRLARRHGAIGLDFQVLRNNESATCLFTKLGAQFCSELVNVSLNCETLQRVCATVWPNPLGVVIRIPTQKDTKAVGAFIRELAEYEGQLEDYVEGHLPFDGAEDDTCISASTKESAAWRASAQFLLAELPTENVSGASPRAPRALGLLIFVPCYCSWSGARLRVECLVVSQEARGKGVGSQLMQSLCLSALAQGIHTVQWVALDSSAGAKRFYQQRLGAEINANGEWYNASLPTV